MGGTSKTDGLMSSPSTRFGPKILPERLINKILKYNQNEPSIKYLQGWDFVKPQSTDMIFPKPKTLFPNIKIHAIGITNMFHKYIHIRLIIIIYVLIHT